MLGVWQMDTVTGVGATEILRLRSYISQQILKRTFSRNNVLGIWGENVQASGGENALF